MTYLTPNEARLVSAERNVKVWKEERRKRREIFDKSLHRLLEATQELAIAETHLTEAQRAHLK